MSAERSTELLTHYFEAMGRDEDLAPFFTADVSWEMVDSQTRVSGPAAVRDYILDLHSRMTSQEQPLYLVTDGHALLEGARVNDDPAIAYCLVYDLTDDAISAMRCYGTIATLMPPG